MAYHCFEKLGINNKVTGFYLINQKCKEDIIINMIKKVKTKIGWVDLFGADGYYSAMAVKNGVESCDVIEKNDKWIADGAHIMWLLKLDKKVNFIKKDVLKLSKKYNVGLCLGGLYHLRKPEELIKKLTEKIQNVLIIQTVIHDGEFVHPAPGWGWGCRFNEKYIIDLLEQYGWEIKQREKNILKANKRECDKQSLYLYCVKTDKKVAKKTVKKKAKKKVSKKK